MYRYKLNEDHMKSLNGYKYVMGSEDEPKDNTQNDTVKKVIEIVFMIFSVIVSLTVLLFIIGIVVNNKVIEGILPLVLLFYSLSMWVKIVVIKINKYLDEIDDRVIPDEVVQDEVVQGKVFTPVNTNNKTNTHTKGNRNQVIAQAKHNKRVRVTGNYSKKRRKIQSHTHKKVVHKIVVFDRHS